MKKILLFLILLSSINVNAQSVVSDEVTSDGIRAIYCETVNVRSSSDAVVFKVGLGAYVINDSISYVLIVETSANKPFKIYKGSRLLLKAFNDEVIELKARDTYDASVGKVKDINGYVFTDYSQTSFYDISETNIRQLITGVKKIRQEHTSGTFDKEFKKDKIGSVLKKEISEIRFTARKKKDFYSDF